MRVTLQMLADELGVTAAAVSMALRNHPRISESTRRKAQALARKRGYVPNPALARQGGVRRSMAKALMPLAWVAESNPSDRSGYLVNNLVDRMLKRLALELGYKLKPYRLGKDLSVARLNEVLWHNGSEAVLLGPIFDEGFTDEFAWDRVSVMSWEVGHVALPCHLVLSDVGWSMVESVKLCRDRGYRRIGLVQIKDTPVMIDYLDRFGAIELCAHTMKWDTACFDFLDCPTGDLSTFLTWVERFKPDAVVGQNMAVNYWLQESGKTAGRDVGLVLFNLPPPIDRFDIDPSGFLRDQEYTARLALRRLDGEVRAFERGKPMMPTRQLVQMPWHEGTTLPFRDALTV